MSKKKYYIAYGSNLSVEQMAVRCPDARVVGNAILYGWQLLFKGCATIEPNPERNTPVLVWEISEWDERSLDRYEGYPSFYYKKDLEVETFPLEGGEPETLTAMVYIMAEGHRLGAPRCWRKRCWSMSTTPGSARAAGQSKHTRLRGASSEVLFAVHF